MTKDEKIELMNKYRKKEIKPGKCKKQYFMNGLLSLFTPHFQKYCPNCCEKISDKEYFNFGTFTYGCKKCRELL